MLLDVLVRGEKAQKRAKQASPPLKHKLTDGNTRGSTQLGIKNLNSNIFLESVWFRPPRQSKDYFQYLR